MDPRNTLPPGPTNPPLHNLNTVPQNPTLRTPTSYAPADLRVHTSSIVPSHSRETPYHVPSDSRQTRGVDPHELNRVTAYLQANFPFIHGVMDVAPGSHISRLEAVCRVIQADVIWSRQCLDKLRLTNNRLTMERHRYRHENEKLRKKINRLDAEKNKVPEASKRPKAELERHRTVRAAEGPLVVEKKTEKTIGRSGPRSDGTVEALQAQVQARSANSLDVSASSNNNKMSKNQRKKEARRIKTEEDQRAFEAMRARLSDTEQMRCGLQGQLAREREKNKALIEQLQSAEQRSFRRSKDLEKVIKKVKVLEGEKWSDRAKITLELEQSRLDLAKARATIDQKDKEEVKRKKAKVREDSDITKITEVLAKYKVDPVKAQAKVRERNEEEFKMGEAGDRADSDIERIAKDLAKAQATIAERDEDVFKMGKAKEYEVRVLVKMLAEQEQTIEDMQLLRDKDGRKIKTLEGTCQALRKRLSDTIRSGSGSMQLRSRKTNMRTATSRGTH